MAGDNPIAVKFEPKDTDPRKDARFTFHRRIAVQPALGNLVVSFFVKMRLRTF